MAGEYRSGEHRLGRWALALTVALFCGAADAAAWKVELAHDPDAAPRAWTDLRGVAAFPGTADVPRGVLASYNNVRGASAASAVVLYERGGGFLAERFYEAEKAKTVAADSRGLVYVGLPGVVEVLAVGPAEAVTDGETLAATTGFAFTVVTRIDLGTLTDSTVGGVEGIGVREGSGGQVRIVVSERGVDARLFAVDVSALPEGQAALSADFGDGGVFALPTAAGIDASLRGLHVDPAGRAWVCANGLGRVLVVDAAGTAEIASLQVPGALDVTTDDQYAYVTTFRGSLSGVFQIALDGIDQAPPPAVELVDGTFFPAPDGSGGLTGIDLDRGSLPGQDELLIGIEEVADALETALGGRDLLIRNGVPAVSDLALQGAIQTLSVAWLFADLDPEDEQIAYRLRLHQGSNASGAILFEALVSASSTTVVVPLAPDSPLPQSVSVSVFDSALEGNSAVIDISATVAAALVEKIQSISGGGCTAARLAASSDGRPFGLEIGMAAALLVLAGRTRRRCARARP